MESGKRNRDPLAVLGNAVSAWVPCVSCARGRQGVGAWWAVVRACDVCGADTRPTLANPGGVTA